MFERYSRKLTARSTALLFALDNRIDRILQTWLLVAGLASAARIAMMPHDVPANAPSAALSYMLLVVAPAASTLLAMRWFKDGDRQPLPSMRLPVFGNWRQLNPDQARRHQLYGTS